MPVTNTTEKNKGALFGASKKVTFANKSIRNVVNISDTLEGY
jgi:hypothetical protein